MSKWYEYLMAVYGGKEDPARRSAYLLAFDGEDAATMLKAVKAASLDSTFLPRVNELAAAVRKVKAEQEADGELGWVRWGQREKTRRAQRAEFDQWTACPDGCGERYPAHLTACPFCADMRETVAA
jgi:hypothetical protein